MDHKNNLFKHPEITRIVGEPTTATLITLQTEIHNNDQTEQCFLGKGAHGHLGLVSFPKVYQALISGF